jgi:hypothetical protein
MSTTTSRNDALIEAFFPRWHKWSVGDSHPRCLGLGYCDTEGKRIIVSPDCPNHDETLIHEICHAVASIRHDKKWQRRMEKAAQKAESIGLKDLAVAIRKDYTAYADPDRGMPVEAASIYMQVEDTVWNHGKWSFEKVVEHVATKNGMIPERFKAKFKRLRTVYEQACRELEEENGARAKVGLPAR